MLRARQRFGKYVIERRLAEGGFAVVYQARDTIEGVRVALKIPYQHLMTGQTIEDFKLEVRLAAKLDHPNILPLKYADFVDEQFVIVTALGEMSLGDRLQRRISVAVAARFAEQMLAGVAHAHQNHIIHCDIKPDNFLIFPGDRIRLADFGIARVAQKTLKGSGAGTLGYIAPEQAMGKPSFRSDVFSLGLVFHQMFAGSLPEWPYHWPAPGYDRLRRRVPEELITLIRRALEVETRKRFSDAQHMLSSFKRVRLPVTAKRRSQLGATPKRKVKQDWQSIRRREFQQAFGKSLETNQVCASCNGPVSESMHCCPWCGKARRLQGDETVLPLVCPRCHRGLKSDWHYCPWCYGPGFEVSTTRSYADRRYVGRCANASCSRGELMPFMCYCPWCRRRVRKKWKIEGSKDQCNRCGWGIVAAYWSYCPWCGDGPRSVVK